MEESYRTLKFISELNVGKMTQMINEGEKEDEELKKNPQKRIENLKSEISYLKKMLNLKRGRSSTNEILLKMRVLEKENDFLKKNYIKKQIYLELKNELQSVRDKLQLSESVVLSRSVTEKGLNPSGDATEVNFTRVRDFINSSGTVESDDEGGEEDRLSTAENPFQRSGEQEGFKSDMEADQIARKSLKRERNRMTQHSRSDSAGNSRSREPRGSDSGLVSRDNVFGRRSKNLKKNPKFSKSQVHKPKVVFRLKSREIAEHGEKGDTYQKQFQMKGVYLKDGYRESLRPLKLYKLKKKERTGRSADPIQEADVEKEQDYDIKFMERIQSQENERFNTAVDENLIFIENLKKR